MQVYVEQLSTPILGEYDIIVAGGGVAGSCAAVAENVLALSEYCCWKRALFLADWQRKG